VKTHIKKNEVHIWLIEYDSTTPFTIFSTSTLSKEEIIKANRFKRIEHGHAWAFFHTAMRDILSRYVGLPAEVIEFALDPKKKPYIKNKIASSLNFNLSHSGHFALLAISTLAPIGVDIEVIKEIPDADNVARQFFSKRENGQLAKISKGKFSQNFYQVWTAKEAVIKANGWGMSAPLDAFDVKVESCSEWFSPTLRNPITNTGVYWIKHLKPKPGCCAAVCFNIINLQAIQSFDHHQIKVKEIFFENNNL
jgi:4'-phosphopantetheinyl transferase